MLSDFYRSKEWVDLIQIIRLERVNDDGLLLCAFCGKPIIKAYDCIGHHSVELTEANVGDATISLNSELIQCVHHRCHNTIHNKLGYAQRQVYLVYGPPLSGKTSWVKDAATEGDLIIDIDSIWQCLSGCPRYFKPNRLRSNVFDMHSRLIEAVRMRRGKWLNAYIIGGYPFEGERERLIKSLGAREVFMDISKDESLQRLYKQTERNIEEWEKYIADWWEKYSPRGSKF